MDTKHWSQSKTILFNVIIALLTVLTAESDTIRELLSDRGYVVFAVFIAVGNAYLRTVTNTAVTLKR